MDDRMLLKKKIMEEEINRLTAETYKDCSPVEALAMVFAMNEIVHHLSALPMSTKVKITKLLYDYYSRAEGILKE